MATSRNSSDSIKSTWRQWDRKYWHPGHWLLETLRLHHVDLDRTFPVHQKTDMVPYAPEWQFHLWILIHAFVPLAIHQTYINFSHQKISATAVYVFYSLSLKAIGIRQLHLLRRVGQKYGFFDGDKHERDGVPDVGVWKTFNSLLGAVAFRPMVATISAYRADQDPSSILWMWLPFKIAAYAVILDFWYYWYHRLMHEKAGLWKFHRTHHLTKHPNPLLSGYADTVQETFDIVVIPLMTSASMNVLGLPISFYEWWVCQQYVIFTELLGHSGLRIEATAVNPMTWLLRMFDMELVIEDHDLHHRYGWKHSHNYGKQTRIWDRLFGTTGSRIEGYKGKIDYVNTAKIPLW